MKRIKEACLFQTVHFALKEDIPPAIAVRAVQEEYRHYIEQLDRKRIRYQITEEKTAISRSPKVTSCMACTPLSARLCIKSRVRRLGAA